jgi:hypothetical protein
MMMLCFLCFLMFKKENEVASIGKAETAASLRLRAFA